MTTITKILKEKINQSEDIYVAKSKLPKNKIRYPISAVYAT